MNLAGLPGGPAPVGGQYSTLLKKPNAHSDSIWSVAWKRQPPSSKQSVATDVIVTGGVDDTVKVCSFGYVQLVLSVVITPVISLQHENLQIIIEFFFFLYWLHLSIE